jgi:hypothetical protein
MRDSRFAIQRERERERERDRDIETYTRTRTRTHTHTHTYTHTHTQVSLEALQGLAHTGSTLRHLRLIAFAHALEGGEGGGGCDESEVPRFATSDSSHSRVGAEASGDVAAAMSSDSLHTRTRETEREILAPPPQHPGTCCTQTHPAASCIPSHGTPTPDDLSPATPGALAAPAQPVTLPSAGHELTKVFHFDGNNANYSSGSKCWGLGSGSLEEGSGDCGGGGGSRSGGRAIQELKRLFRTQVPLCRCSFDLH